MLPLVSLPFDVQCADWITRELKRTWIPNSDLCITRRKHLISFPSEQINQRLYRMVFSYQRKIGMYRIQKILTFVFLFLMSMLQAIGFSHHPLKNYQNSVRQVDSQACPLGKSTGRHEFCFPNSLQKTLMMTSGSKFWTSLLRIFVLVIVHKNRLSWHRKNNLRTK